MHRVTCVQFLVLSCCHYASGTSDKVWQFCMFQVRSWSVLHLQYLNVDRGLNGLKKLFFRGESKFFQYHLVCCFIIFNHLVHEMSEIVQKQASQLSKALVDVFTCLSLSQTQRYSIYKEKSSLNKGMFNIFVLSVTEKKYNWIGFLFLLSINYSSLVYLALLLRQRKQTLGVIPPLKTIVSSRKCLIALVQGSCLRSLRCAV